MITGEGIASPLFFDQVTALGYCPIEKDPNRFVIPSLHQNDHWDLRNEGSHWILFIHDTPQISFLPEQALQFLKKRKCPTSTPHSQRS